MKLKRLLLSAACLLIFGLTNADAQQAIPSAGGNASGSGGSVSYTVGQVNYTTNSGTNGSAVQGIQQPFEIFVVTGLSGANGISLVCSAFPNPATVFVILKVENYNIEYLAYQLYDITGKLVGKAKVTGTETNVDMSRLVISTYFLKVMENNQEVKIFKIIKK